MAGVLRIFRPKIPEPVREHRFHETRQWRFDFAWPAFKVALEVEGGTWMRPQAAGWGAQRGGGHGQPIQFEEDCVKYGEAAVDGWLVLRVTGAMIEDGRAGDLVYRTLLGVQHRDQETWRSSRIRTARPSPTSG